MKKPQEAPTYAQITEAFRKSALPTHEFEVMFEKVRGPLVGGKYLHWDELQYREPPKGLSREHWWVLLKLNRLAQRQITPFSGKSSAPFGYVLADPIPQRLHEIDLRAGGQIKMPEQVTNHETKDEYYVSSLIEEAITSSQLEGAVTTRQVAKEMLRTGRPPHDRSERMILNNFLTMQRIGTIKDRPLSKELIFEIHRQVTDETLDDPSAAGRFRREDEAVGVYDDTKGKPVLLHQPPRASELEDRVQRLCDFANRSEPFVHPVIRSIVLHFMLGYDHPFVDGNGRTARALFYWSMLRHGYWLAEFISISGIVIKVPAQYSRAFLFTETDEGDLTYFILYHLEIVMKAIASLYEYIARKTEEIRTVEAELQGIELLNHRQQALVRHAMRHPGKRYTVEEHRRSHNVSYESARSDLLDLDRRGLLAKRKEGKKWIFTPQPPLAVRLAALKT